MGRMVEELMARTHELLQPNPGSVVGLVLFASRLLFLQFAQLN